MKEHTANHSLQKIIIRKYFQLSLKYNNLNKTFLKEKDVS